MKRQTRGLEPPLSSWTPACSTVSHTPLRSGDEGGTPDQEVTCPAAYVPGVCRRALPMLQFLTLLAPKGTYGSLTVQRQAQLRQPHSGTQGSLSQGLSASPVLSCRCPDRATARLGETVCVLDIWMSV